VSGAFDPYHRWLGIPPKDQPANHYRLLGIELFESDLEVIRDAAEQRMAHVRGYALGQYAELSQKILNELATARACLLNAEDKTAYDRALRQELPPQEISASSLPPPLPFPVGMRVSTLHNSLHVMAVVVLVAGAVLGWPLFRQQRVELAETASGWAAAQQAEEQAHRKVAEEQAHRKAAEEQAALQRAEREALGNELAKEKAARKKAEEQFARLNAANEEAKKKKAEEEAVRKAGVHNRDHGAHCSTLWWRYLGVCFVTRSTIREELNLSHDQLSKLGEAAGRVQQVMYSGGSFPLFFHFAGSFGEQRAKIIETLEAEEEAKEVIEAVLLPKQLERLNGIALQVAGISAMMDKDVQRDLKLSDDQVTQIETIRKVSLTKQQKNQREMSEKRGKIMKGRFDTNTLEGRKKASDLNDLNTRANEAMKRLSEECDGEVMEVLSVDQKALLQKMKGATFGWSRDSMRPPLPARPASVRTESAAIIH
jgi:hypothetical protein